MKNGTDRQSGCGCDAGWNRREFFAAMGTAGGAIAWTPALAGGEPAGAHPAGRKQGAVVRAAFLYPPSKTFAGES